MVAPRFAKLFAVAVSAALVCSMAGVPAYALTDTNLDEMAGASAGASAITSASTDESSSLQNQPSADDAESMPDNPTKDLPQTVSEAVPDDATVVSEELAVTDAGEVMDLETGDTVTDPQLVGTVDKPADPLAKTDGESFIPVEVAEVKEAMGDAAAEAEPDDAADTEDDGDVAETQRDVADDGAAGAVVRPAALQNNSYGAHWGTYNGTPAFFESDGTLFAQQAKGVIDVSEWQGQIDWQKAKNDGVEGAIIRISYGWGNGFDKQALRNISECKRLGIPFGIYSYSYAYDSTTAAYEGDDMVNLLRQAGVQPGDLSYPVFYDLEKWTWTGHTPPASPSVYDGIVNAWYAKLQAAGYTNLSVYSYTNYLDTALNSANIRNKTRWVASYGARTNFPYATNDRGWQYTSQGSVAGIQGSVDLNAFGNKTYQASHDVTSMTKVEIPNGTYYINAYLKDSSSLEIAGGGTQNGIKTQLYGYNKSGAQRFTAFRCLVWVGLSGGDGAEVEFAAGQVDHGAEVVHVLESAGSGLDVLDDAVESFEDRVGVGVVEVGEDVPPVAAYLAGELFHGFESGARHPRAQTLEGRLGLGSIGAGVVDVLAGLAHLTGASGFQSLPLQAALGFQLQAGQVRFVPQPQVLGPLEQRVAAGLLFADLVDGLVGVFDHVELVDDSRRVGQPLADALGEPQAHVAGNQTHPVGIAVVVHEIPREPFDRGRVLARDHADYVALHQVGDHGDVPVALPAGLVDAYGLHARVVLVKPRLVHVMADEPPQAGVMFADLLGDVRDRLAFGQLHDHRLEQEREPASRPRPRHRDRVHAVGGARHARHARVNERLVLEEVQMPPHALPRVMHRTRGLAAPRFRAGEPRTRREPDRDMQFPSAVLLVTELHARHPPRVRQLQGGGEQRRGIHTPKLPDQHHHPPTHSPTPNSERPVLHSPNNPMAAT